MSLIKHVYVKSSANFNKLERARQGSAREYFTTAGFSGPCYHITRLPAEICSSRHAH